MKPLGGPLSPPLAVAAAAAAAAAAAVLCQRLLAGLLRRKRPPALSDADYGPRCFWISCAAGAGTPQRALCRLLPRSAAVAEALLAAEAGDALREARVLGMDCEWRPERGGGVQSPVALLQLSAGGECWLAPLLHMDRVPAQLAQALQDPLVIKVGVGVREDARRLAADRDVLCHSIVDLADVARGCPPLTHLLSGGAGLAALCRAALGEKLDKQLQCSDWAAQQLSDAQLEYAARDAWLALCLAEQLHRLVEQQQQQQQQQQQRQQQQWRQRQWRQQQQLCAFLAPFVLQAAGSYPREQPLLPGLPPRGDTRHQGHRQAQQCSGRRALRPLRLLLLAQGLEPRHAGAPLLAALLDVQLRAQQPQRRQRQRQHKQQGQREEWQADPLQQERRRRQLEQLQRLGAAQGGGAAVHSIFDRLHQLKPARQPTRKSLQYENCRILGPDGAALATCGAKKARLSAASLRLRLRLRLRGTPLPHRIRWYLERGLADVVCTEPSHVAIQLKFQPRGSGHADDQYYLSDKDNRCVVCGHDSEYLRHSIVPHAYRQHFPECMKSHLSHDVVLLCAGCHQIANIMVQRRMQQLGQRYGAPLENEAMRFQTDRQLSQVLSAAKALASPKAAQIPQERTEQLRRAIMMHLGEQEWRHELLAQALKVQPKRQADGWESHAAVVVAAVIAEGSSSNGSCSSSDGCNSRERAAGAPDAALEEFVKGWRRHFLEAMRPKHLPPFWSVDARVKNSSGVKASLSGGEGRGPSG